jgi:hypothetical protein
LASGVETEDGMPPIEIIVPVNGYINASETLTQISTVGPNVSSASFSLYWQNGENDLGMTLKSPSGLVIDQSAQPPTIYEKGNQSIYYIVQDPEAGNWTAMIEALNVSAQGEEFTFFGDLLGNEAIPENITEPESLSEAENQTNIT